MIREITPADLDEVLEVWRAACYPSHPFLSAEWMRRTEAQMRATLVARRAAVLEEDGAVRAFLSRQEHYIDALFVAPAFQGRGLGKRLLDHAKAQLPLIVLSAFGQNPRAVRFYQREGFWATEVKTHRETSETIILLRWERPK